MFLWFLPGPLYVELKAGASASLIYLKIYNGCWMQEKIKLQLNYFYTEFELLKNTAAFVAELTEC